MMLLPLHLISPDSSIESSSWSSSSSPLSVTKFSLEWDNAPGHALIMADKTASVPRSRRRLVGRSRSAEDFMDCCGGGGTSTDGLPRTRSYPPRLVRRRNSLPPRSTKEDRWANSASQNDRWNSMSAAIALRTTNTSSSPDAADNDDNDNSSLFTTPNQSISPTMPTRSRDTNDASPTAISNSRPPTRSHDSNHEMPSYPNQLVHSPTKKESLSPPPTRNARMPIRKSYAHDFRSIS